MDESGNRAALTNIATGVLFIALGGLAAYTSLEYDLGTLRRMGPGFFPLLISILLLGCGIGLCLFNLRAALAGRGVSLTPAAMINGLRGMAVVFACIIAFALLINRVGLAPTALVCAVIAYFGSLGLMAKGGTVKEGLIVAVCLSAFVVGVFIYGIGLPMSVWPQ